MINYDIGKTIKQVVEKDEQLSMLMDKNGNSKVFPIIAEAETTFPFIVYRRSSYTPRSDKDYINEIVGVELIVCSQGYKEGAEIANRLTKDFDRYEDSIIDEIQVTNLSENYASDTYVQYISMSVLFK